MGASQFFERVGRARKTEMGTSVNDGEVAVGFGECGRKAPGGQAFGSAFVTDRFAFAVVNLPGDGAALVPAGAFRRGKQDFPASIGDGDGMLGGCFGGDRR